MSSFADARAGAAAVAPMLVGVIPFGLVAGASAIAHDLDMAKAIGLSTMVFAGASQLAMIDVFSDGGSALLAVAVALTINLRLVLYSASVAPYLSGVSLPRRLCAAYLLVDQVYAAAVSRWPTEQRPDARIPFMAGAGGLLWVSWQVSTVAGGVIGGSVPDSVPLEFALPLVFLVLLVPIATNRPAVVAATVGGVTAVIVAELGAGAASIILGALGGIVAGTIADVLGSGAGDPNP